jgi:heme/copper-type cytochrome/quinol oxidase subunit 4
MQLDVLCRGGFDPFLQFVLHPVPVFSTRWFGDEGLQVCIAWVVSPTDVLSTIARSHCKQRVFLRSSKPCVAMAFAALQVLLSLIAFLVFFQALVDEDFGRKKTTSVLFNVILFSLCHCASNCWSLVPPIVFLDMNQI